MKVWRVTILGVIMLVLLSVLLLLQYTVLLDFFRFNHILFLKNQHKYNDAINEYQRYFADEELSPRQLEPLVDLFVLNGDFTTALELSQELVSVEPLEPRHHFRAGLLFHLLSKFEHAYESFKQCKFITNTHNIDVNPDEMTLVDIYIAWYNQDWSHIIKILEPVHDLTSIGLEKRAWSRLSYKDYIITLRHTLLGAAYYNLQLHVKAQQVLEDSLSFFYGEPLTHFYLGLTYCNLGDYDMGHYYLTISRVLLPGITRLAQKTLSPLIFYPGMKSNTIKKALRPMVYLKEYEHADYILDMLSTNTLTAGEYYNLKGIIHEKLDHPDRARAFYRRNLDYEPDNIHAAYRLSLNSSQPFTSDSIKGFSFTTFELEELPGNGTYKKLDDMISMARNNDGIVIECKDIINEHRETGFILMGVGGHSMVRNRVGAVVGVYLNDALIARLFFDTENNDLRTFMVRYHDPDDVIKLLFINNFILHLDSENEQGDRNVYLDKLLVFKKF